MIKTNNLRFSDLVLLLYVLGQLSSFNAQMEGE